ncbi:MAG: pyridoxal phosphate-dependent aminotransferase [Oscillospiraceae bacterium]|nr:pyridoxal phosphate-dependent aminotransferase [Oscillospiraceae bacterium]
MFVQSMMELGSKRSCIRELFDYGMRKAKEIGADNVYDYSIGNPSVPAPAAVKEAILEIMEKQSSVAVHGYTAAIGTPDVRVTVADDLNARYNAGIRPENLFFTCGAAPALVAILRALAVENSEFVILAPYFPEYTVFINCTGGKPVIVPANTETFEIDVNAIEKALTSRTQAIIINSPNNPSGVIYTREELTALSNLLRRKSEEYGHPIYIIADEPYRELVYDGAEVPFIPNLYENTIVCYSYSKSLSLPGERIGYVCVPDAAADSQELYFAIAGAARACGHVCAPSLMQKVIQLCAAVRPDVEIYDRNRQTLYQALTEYGYRCVKPNGAFYMLVEAPDGDGNAFSDRAKEKNILIAPGDGFGIPSFCRLSTCVSPDMIERSLPAFKALMDEYKK